MKLLIYKSTRNALGFVALSAVLSGCSPGGLGNMIEVSHTTTSTSSTTGSSKNERTAFVESRFAAIRYDAARGYGENLDTLASLLGEPDRREFARWMKANYRDLFAGPDIPSQLLARIETQRNRES